MAVPARTGARTATTALTPAPPPLWLSSSSPVVPGVESASSRRSSRTFT